MSQFSFPRVRPFRVDRLRQLFQFGLRFEEWHTFDQKIDALHLHELLRNNHAVANIRLLPGTRGKCSAGGNAHTAKIDRIVSVALAKAPSDEVSLPAKTRLPKNLVPDLQFRRLDFDPKLPQ